MELLCVVGVKTRAQGRLFLCSILFGWPSDRCYSWAKAESGTAAESLSTRVLLLYCSHTRVLSGGRGSVAKRVDETQFLYKYTNKFSVPGVFVWLCLVQEWYCIPHSWLVLCFSLFYMPEEKSTACDLRKKKIRAFHVSHVWFAGCPCCWPPCPISDCFIELCAALCGFMPRRRLTCSVSCEKNVKDYKSEYTPTTWRGRRRYME